MFIQYSSRRGAVRDSGGGGVGEKGFKSKRKTVWGWGEKKVPKKKKRNRDHGKIKGRAENKVAKINK